MSLPLLHAGRTNPGLSAALDLRFALDKSLTAYRGPTPSFSRASTGSYFDGSGVLRYAAVNILTYSENFSHDSWAKYQATVTSDSVVAPDGKTTADTLTETLVNSTHLIIKTSSTLAGTVYTSSIYAKAGTRKYIDVTSVAQDGGINRRFNNVFDLETGTWQSTASLNSPANTSYSITSVGNGWYRISSSILAYGSNHYLVVYLSDSANPTRDASNDIFYTGNGTGNFYIWGAQVEASSTVGTYVPTTSSANSAPRFNHTYNGTSWVSRGLLVEEQRSNFCLQSNFQSGWSGQGTSQSINQAQAPDGTNTGTKVTVNTSGNYRSVYRTLSGSANCISVFAKANGFNWITVIDQTGGFSVAWFNISGGTVGKVLAGYTAAIQDVGNGWYRCSVGHATSWTVASVAQFNLVDGDNTDYGTASGSNGVFLWGSQAENKQFATSLIPTTSSSVTRSADVCQITGGDFLGFWNGTEGTVVAEFDVSSGYTSPDLTIANFYQSGSSWIGLRSIGSTSNNIFDCYSAGVQQARLGFSRSNPGISTRLAAAFKANDFAASQNGSAVSTDTSGSLPSPTYLELGTFTGFGEYLNGHIAKLIYYPARLTNTKLQQLST